MALFEKVSRLHSFLTYTEGRGRFTRILEMEKMRCEKKIKLKFSSYPSFLFTCSKSMENVGITAENYLQFILVICVCFQYRRKL